MGQRDLSFAESLKQEDSPQFDKKEGVKRTTEYILSKEGFSLVDSHGEFVKETGAGYQ